MPRNYKLQSAIDFMASYGPVLSILTLVFIAMLTIATNPPLTYSCTAPPGFSCSYISINTTGAMVAKFAQALGTQLTINGVACADQQSYTADNPLYGNMAVNALASSYPPVYYSVGNVVYSGSYFLVSAYCYKASAKAAGSLGSQFTGYVWLNYTVPGYSAQVQKIATFTASYTKGAI